MQQSPEPVIAAQSTSQSYSPVASFAPAVLTLLSGNVVAQMLPYLATFILARLYSPSSFGNLALFTSITAAVSIAATGRYEQAIPLPNQEKDANSLVLVASLAGLIISIVFGCSLYILSQIWPDYFAIKNSTLMLSATIFFIAVYQTLTMWFLRHGMYRQISGTRFLQAGITVLVSLVAGLAGWQRGLVLGYMSGWLAGSLCYLILLIRSRRFIIKSAVVLIQKNATMFFQHALYGAVPALLSNLAFFLLVYIITRHYGSSCAGQFSLSWQFAYGPASLIAGAIAQVLLRESSLCLSKQQSDVALFRSMTRYLSYAAALYILILVFAAPSMFSVFFGLQWQNAGLFTAILAAGYGIRLAVTALSSFLLSHRALGINGAWQAAYFIVIGSLYFFYPNAPSDFLTGLTLLDLLMYGFYYFLIRSVVIRSNLVESSL